MAKRNLATSISGLPKTIWKFAFEAKDELKKVTWPTRQTTINYTIVVIVGSLVIGGVTGGVDYLLSQILNLAI